MQLLSPSGEAARQRTPGKDVAVFPWRVATARPSVRRAQRRLTLSRLVEIQAGQATGESLRDVAAATGLPHQQRHARAPELCEGKE